MFTLLFYLCFLSSSHSLVIEDKIAEKFNLPKGYVKESISKAEIVDKITDLISKPAETKEWGDYKKIFVNEQRISMGRDFYRKYREELERAENEFYVSSEIIAAILGVETFFGRYSPEFNALDSLYTLAMNFERRREYFTYELGNLLVYSYKNNINPKEIRSSYAGAIGYPQFMPSNILKYAVDFDEDGQVDLVNSMSDAIGSVANFLKQHGWHYSDPTAVSVVYGSEKLTGEWMSISKLKEKGVSFPFGLSGHKAKLIRLKDSEKDIYWAVFHNFEVLKRYNPSNKYALSVLLLAVALK